MYVTFVGYSWNEQRIPENPQNKPMGLYISKAFLFEVGQEAYIWGWRRGSGAIIRGAYTRGKK